MFLAGCSSEAGNQAADQSKNTAAVETDTNFPMTAWPGSAKIR